MLPLRIPPALLPSDMGSGAENWGDRLVEEGSGSGAGAELPLLSNDGFLSQGAHADAGKQHLPCN